MECTAAAGPPALICATSVRSSTGSTCTTYSATDSTPSVTAAAATTATSTTVSTFHAAITITIVFLGMPLTRSIHVADSTHGMNVAVTSTAGHACRWSKRYLHAMDVEGPVVVVGDLFVVDYIVVPRPL